MSERSVPPPPWLLPPPVLMSQHDDRRAHWLDAVETVVSGIPAVGLRGLRRRLLTRIVAETNRHAAALRRADDAALVQEARALRRRLRREGLADAPVGRAFALIRELAERTVGQRHFDVQLLGGFVLLKGMVAEMETGEGKTLTATLAAGAAALAGIPVHVVTVNDYLAARDAEWMEPVYRRLGLRIGTVVHGMTPEERRAAYACDIVYCSNKEIAFDYLRDRIVLGKHGENLRLKLEALGGEEARRGRLVMRGLHFAIVDEADSVLVDEARTPLIISGQPEGVDEGRWAREALDLADRLVAGEDYRVFYDERRVELTDAGTDRLAELGEDLGGLWHGRVRREESIRQALTARYLFECDVHYLVREGKVEIVDEYTGRVMPDRTWTEGLHQLIEAKEGCTVSERKQPVARISYQRFFRRYRRLAGMSGTVREVRNELWSVYRLAVITVPTNRPVRRQDRPDAIFRGVEAKYAAIVARAAALREAGRPVLIGTRSVSASEGVSRELAAAGLDHVVLNAAQDRDEAEIIAAAGGAGRITVATNMAGRGVDIRLADGVAERGGLYVILSERHDARRIDRQLIGRCGRQGDPGTSAALLSLDDSLLDVLPWSGLRHLGRVPGRAGDRLARLLFAVAQRRAERIHSRMRRSLLKSDRKLGDFLAFSGRME